jgi:hypothetical protein
VEGVVVHLKLKHPSATTYNYHSAIDCHAASSFAFMLGLKINDIEAP